MGFFQTLKTYMFIIYKRLFGFGQKRDINVNNNLKLPT